MNTLIENLLNDHKSSSLSFCKFISANDAGITGAHQSGIYIPKNSFSILFDSVGRKGENKERFINIKWQNTFSTESCFKYYGKGTRNEYRITRFGRGFEFLSDEYVGALFVLTKQSDDDYSAYVLNTDDEIEYFFSSIGISATETNCLIESQSEPLRLENLFSNYISTLSIDFPTTLELSTKAREFFNAINQSTALTNPDKELVNWLNTEYELFKYLENNRYASLLSEPFKTVDDLIKCSNTILNRRKSRAGKSLEHHLASIFTLNNIEFSAQAITEDNKKPDFIFPSEAEYHNISFDVNGLDLLAAKTTCKDRWRQILNEADRIQTKHLFTLQQGISTNQLTEMYNSNVVLVVPEQYKSSFPPAFRDRILSLKNFLDYIQSKR